MTDENAEYDSRHDYNTMSSASAGANILPDDTRMANDISAFGIAEPMEQIPRLE